MDDLAMSLTSEQTDKILQFQDLTGIDNMTVCRDVLQRHSWDLEVAVQDQLNIREGRPTVFATESAPPPVFSDPAHQQVFFAPPTGYRWGGTLGYVLSLVFQFCFSTLSTFLRFTFRFLWRDPQRQVTDPVGDVLKFISYFEENFGRNHPVFYQGSYSQVLNDAKQELRFLLVYLHVENIEQCNNFCRRSLSSPNVINYINSNMLFWACSTNSGEGYRVNQTLQESTFPFLAVIVLKEGRMTVVGRLCGYVEPDELLNRLQTIVISNEASLIAARADRIERSFNQTLRRQQDEAYEESLRADQEKERQRCLELEKLETERKKQKLLEEAERERKEELKRQKMELLNLIPSEPPARDPETVSILFKMPNGDRLERRFKHSNTLRDVFNFLFCHPASPDSFEITTNFPKRVLEWEGEHGRQTLFELGLKKKEVLFVYDLEA